MARGMVVINEDRCKGCGLCVSVCPVEILQLAEERFNVKGYHPVEVTDSDKCTGCAMCATICPDVVFTVYRRRRKRAGRRSHPTRRSQPEGTAGR
jgi:2-oxoglutarate ferredoxin oxidoreductase subunit delta